MESYINETGSKTFADFCCVWRGGGCVAGTFAAMKKVALLVFAMVLFFAYGCAPKPAETEEFFAMNTICTQTLYGGGKELIQKNKDSIVRLEKKLSKTIEGSDVWKINHATQAGVEVDAETANLLGECLKMFEKTDGAFHPALGAVTSLWGFGTGDETVPQASEIDKLLAIAGTPEKPAVTMQENIVYTNGAQVDLGGAVKGYALDVLRKNIQQDGGGAALVSLGGSIYAHGTKPDGKEWTIGIRNPQGSAADYVCSLTLEDECISTSGAYERGFTQDGVYYHHIIDPQTGFPAESGLLSVSVVDQSGLYTDILSTALFVMGLEKGMAFAEQNGYSVVFITEDKQIVTTKNFGRNLTIKDNSYHAG